MTATRISDLEARVEKLEATSTTCVNTYLHACQDPHVAVLKPIPVSIRRLGDEYIASFLEANISVSGETEEEGFGDLANLIETTFKTYTALEEENLGPGPKRQLAILRQFLSITE
jgi:hypothetical protein